MTQCIKHFMTGKFQRFMILVYVPKNLTKICNYSFIKEAHLDKFGVF